MAVVTAANSPYSFKGPPAVLGVNLTAGGTVRTEIAVDGTWVNTGDAYPQGALYCGSHRGGAFSNKE